MPKLSVRFLFLIALWSGVALSAPVAADKGEDAQVLFAAIDAQDRADATLFKLEALARKGNREAQFRLGLIYVELNGLPEALDMFRRAARQGDANARLYVLMGYRTGIPPLEDEKKQYGPSAADSNDPEDLLDKGLHYQYGRLVPKDEKRAVALFEQAVAQGSRHAMTLLGRIHDHSQDAAIKDQGLARKWYQRGMEANEPLSMHNLSAVLDRNKETEDQGVPYLKKAADMGFSASLNDLGRKYKHGGGVPKDQDKAEALFRRAAALGYTDARYQLALLLKARWESENTRLNREFQEAWDKGAERINKGERADKVQAEFRTINDRNRSEKARNNEILHALTRMAAGSCYGGEADAAILALGESESVKAFKTLPRNQMEGTASCLLAACLQQGEDKACHPAVLSTAELSAASACLRVALKEFERGLKGWSDDWRQCVKSLPEMTESHYVTYVRGKKPLDWKNVDQMPRELVSKEILLKMRAALPEQAVTQRKIVDQSLERVNETIASLEPGYKEAQQAKYKDLMRRVQYFRSQWKPPAPGCGSRPSAPSVSASRKEFERARERSQEFVDCARRWLEEVKQGNLQEIVGEDVWQDRGRNLYSLDDDDLKRMREALEAIHIPLRREVEALNAEWKDRDARVEARNEQAERANLRRELEATMRANQRALENAYRPVVPDRPMFILPGMN